MGRARTSLLAAVVPGCSVLCGVLRVPMGQLVKGQTGLGVQSVVGGRERVVMESRKLLEGCCEQGEQGCECRR